MVNQIQHLKFTLLLSLTLLSASFVFQSCKDDPGPDPVPENPVSTLRFSYTVDGDPLQFDTVMYQNLAGNLYSVETLKYFVSDIMLISENGDTVLIDDIIYLDAMDPLTTSHKYRHKIANHLYTELRFTFGLDTLRNQNNLFSSFPESAMEWPIPMGGGYHYMKLEGRINDEGIMKTFNVHTGMLNGNPNHFYVSLPLELNITKESFSLGIAMEINNWFQNPNTFDLTTITSGMMGNQTAQQLIKDNGHDVFSIVE